MCFSYIMSLPPNDNELPVLAGNTFGQEPSQIPSTDYTTSSILSSIAWAEVEVAMASSVEQDLPPRSSQSR